MIQPPEERITFSISTSMKDISREEWERLFGTDTVESLGYHAAIEEAGLQEFKLYCLTAQKSGSTIAVIPFFTTEFSFATIIQGGLQKIILKAQSFASNFLKIRILFIGLPTAEELYIGLPGPNDIPAVMDKALQAIDDFAGKEKISMVLFYNLSEKHRALAEYLKRKGFVGMENFPNTRIKISSHSLDDFIQNLGKNTRKELRRKLKESKTLAELTTEVRTDVNDMIDEIYKLYLNNFSEGDVHFEKLTPEFFLRISHLMPEETRFFITREGEKIIAFNLCLIKGKNCIDKFVGFDAVLSRKYHLYYTTFCHNIEWCIMNKIEYYQMGITDYDPKIRLGARLIPLHVYGRFRNPLINCLARLVIGMLSPVNFDPALKRHRERIKKNKTMTSSQG